MTGTVLSSKKYSAYPEYKDSGVEWLSEIPIDWNISRLKFITSIFGRIGFRGYTTADIVDEGEGALVLSPSNVFDGKLDLDSRAYLSWDKYYESPEIIVEPDDILLVKTGSTYGKSAIVDDNSEPMTINPQMALLKQSKIPAKYLAYVMSSDLIKAIIEVSNTGSGMPTMTQENINSFPIPMPCERGAETIANFLDHETAKIDTLIAKQDKLIELLKEKRQAVISHAVTRGLNPDTPMKDSGVEWLGEVPEHWQVVKLSYFLKLQSGDTITSSLIEKEGKNPVFGGNGQRGFTSSYNCDGEYVLIGRQGALCGNINIAKNKFFASEHAVVVYPYVKFNLTFISEFLRFMNLGQYSVSAAQPGISVERINGLKIAIPPLNEQITIAKYLENKISIFERLTEKSTIQITLLKERKVALISAAVTGKIDVRNWIKGQSRDE